MRKVVAVPLALAVVFALVGVAYAVNEYALTKAETFPAGVGKPSKPVPKGVKFDYAVKDSAGPRGAPVERYKIAFQGLTAKYASKFKQCRFSDTSADAPLATILQRCKAAVIGAGRVESLVTTEANAGDPNSVLFYCNLKLTLINIPGGISIRLDADPPAAQSQDGPFGCIVPTHRAINARFVNKRIQGVPSGSLEFAVPPDLRHNVGLVVTVARTSSTINRKVTRARIGGVRRPVGFYSSIGCGKRNKRIIQVTFVDENGVSSSERKTNRC
ncbi:MAG TPA: hypothetical protein VK307_07600 [Thermoleophilaceae bacterium]|nr:hypothetical protein [Thermoleophilaceae bacterium]